MAAAILTGNLGPTADASTGPIPLNCNRACLENLVDQYLAAVVAHDPKRLPLSKDVMYTENDQVIEIGDGFWKTAEGRGKYTHIFADPEFGQVAYMGTMNEAGGPILMSLRLRIELGRITEIESVYFKPGGGGPNNIASGDNLPVNPDAYEPKPAADCNTTPDSLIVHSALYPATASTLQGASGFNGFTVKNDGSKVSVAADLNVQSVSIDVLIGDV